MVVRDFRNVCSAVSSEEGMMDMDFFRKIAVAAFSNPFTDQRVEADRRVVGAKE